MKNTLPTIVISLALAVVAGYLLGSINWAIIWTRFFQQRDIRSAGSGNAGMTNVLRTVGKLPAVLTFAGDFLKNVAAVELSGLILTLGYQWNVGEAPGFELLQVGRYLAGAACVVGHIFPVYYGFRGGKGIVAAAAMIAIVDWRVFLLIISTFLVLFIWKKIISLASVVCAAAYPAYTFLVVFFLDFSGSPLAGNGGRSLGYLVFATVVALGIGGLVLVKHRGNIGRLMRGEEKPITAKK